MCPPTLSKPVLMIGFRIQFRERAATGEGVFGRDAAEFLCIGFMLYISND